MTTLRSLTLLAGVFLLLHALPRVPSAPLWGVDFLSYGPGAGVLAAALGGLLLVPGVQRRIAGILTALPAAANPWTSRVAFAGCAVVGGALALLLGIGLRSSVHLLGDGDVHLQILSGAAESELPQKVNARLTYWILGAAVRSFPGASLERVAQTASWISGAVYWLVSLVAARSLGRGSTERTVLLAFLLTPGFVAVFFGYVETYAVLFAGTLIYLWTGAQTMGGRGPWMVPAAWLGVVIALHPLNIGYLPAWLVFSARRQRVAGDRRETVRRVVLAASIPIVVAAGLLAVTGFPITEYLRTKSTSSLLPFFSAPDFLQAYRVGSWRHALDVLNQYLLATPAALLGWIVLRPRMVRKDLDVAFLFGSATLPILFTLLVNPEIGAFRDWDVMSIGAVPLTLAVGLAVVRSAAPETLARVGVLVIGMAALHTAGWTLVSADAAASEARFRWLLEHAALSTHARAYGWETFANHLHSRDRPDEALEAYGNALRADASNHRYWNHAGSLLFDLHEPQRALTYFARAKELDPTYPPTWMNEGIAYFRVEAWEPAAKSLERALELDPELDRARYLVSQAYRHLGRYAEAVAHVREHLVRNPTDVEALFLLGSLHFEMDDIPSALDGFARMVDLDPRDHRAYYNLGVCYYNQGRLDLARENFGRVLALQPTSPEANIIRSRMGGSGP